MASGQDFFAKLPSGRLLPKEVELREALIHAATLATELLPEHVPVQDWVDRRMPGEVQLGYNEDFRVTLCSGEAGDKKESESFLAELPVDEFLPEEDALRAALLESLTSTPVLLKQIAAHPRIANITRDFLPPHVPLADWIDWRIGREASLSTDERGRHFAKLAFGAESPAKQPRPKEQRPDHFFAVLPADSYTEEEDRLRDALFDVFASWQSPELATLMDLKVNKAVNGAERALMPPGVSLREWIETRMGGEITFRQDARGRVAVDLSQQALARVKEIYESQKSAQVATPTTEEVHDTFYASLPTKKLSRLEQDLRDKVMEFLEAWESKHPDGPAPSLSDAGSHPGVPDAKAALLPKGLSLKEWIERRCKEIKFKKIANGQYTLSKKLKERTADPNKKALSNVASSGENPEGPEEAFLESLPQDEFLQEEQDLRELLLAYIEKYPRDLRPPQVHNFAADPEVQALHQALLPDGVRIESWIDRRMGGEIETRAIGAGKMMFALRGELDSYGEAAAKKRKMSR